MDGGCYGTFGIERFMSFSVIPRIVGDHFSAIEVDPQGAAFRFDMQLTRLNNGPVDHHLLLIALHERSLNAGADNDFMEGLGIDGLTIYGAGNNDQQTSNKKARKMEHEKVFDAYTDERGGMLQGGKYYFLKMTRDTATSKATVPS